MDNQNEQPKIDKIHIVVELNKDGEVRVEGPLQDKILCLGLLEYAKVIVLNTKTETLVQPATKHSILDFVRRKK